MAPHPKDGILYIQFTTGFLPLVAIKPMQFNKT
jgi:hypothetical protein